MRSPQVASAKLDVAIDNAFQNDPAVSCAELAANVQLGSAAHGSYRTSSFAARRVILHGRFQNQQVRNIAGVAIAAGKTCLKRFVLSSWSNKFS